MTTYTFDGLSAFEFELLAKDLLESELGIALESFGQGPDKGIDLRHSRNRKKHLIVQCKHYLRSDFRDLERIMKSEKEKVAELAPKRYILCTSMSMSPARKDKLVRAMAPFLASPQDIYGMEDLNGLVRKFPAVERTHFKLWLTSTEVLRRLLNSGLYEETAASLAEITASSRKYVPNQSFARAMEILEKSHNCVISGIPGIGKTTLAEVVVSQYLNEGYQAFRLWGSVEDAWKVFVGDEKQIFFYDDFLGQTALVGLAKNEDSRLVLFMKQVAAMKNKRFVLTTREYILNRALQTYGKLADGELNMVKSMILLEDYTKAIRARILYNHLYFSQLPQNVVVAFTQPQVYRPIIEHRNFNPRLIGAMIDLSRQPEDPQGFVGEFMTNLNNPWRVWDVAFSEHLEPSAQDLLLVLTTLPAEVSLEVLRRAFEAFEGVRGVRLPRERKAYEFERAVKLLDGTFIRTKRRDGWTVGGFQNPSIRDYMEAWLRAHPGDVLDLLNGASIAEQPLYLRGLVEPGLPLVRAYRRTFGTRLSVAPESILFATGEAVEGAQGPEALSEMRQLAAELQHALIGDDEISVASAVRIVRLVTDGKLPGEGRGGELYRSLRKRALGIESWDTLEDFEELTEFISDEGDVSEEDVERIRVQFGDWFKDMDDLDYDDWSQALTDLEQAVDIAGRLGVKPSGVDRIRSEFEERLSEQVGHDEDDDESYRYSGWSHRDDGDAAITAMFESLRDRAG